MLSIHSFFCFLFSLGSIGYGIQAKTRNSQEFPGIHVLQNLEELSAERIREIQTLAEDSDSFIEILGGSLKIPIKGSSSSVSSSSSVFSASSAVSSHPLMMAEDGGGAERRAEIDFYHLLWIASVLFSEDNSLKKNASKRIFLFTDADSPNSGDAELRNRSFQKAKDLQQLGVEMEVFALEAPADGQKFDVRKFYSELLNYGNYGMNHPPRQQKQFEESLENPWRVSLLGALDERLRMKEYKKRSLATVPLQITPDVKISVKM